MVTAKLITIGIQQVRKSTTNWDRWAILRVMFYSLYFRL